MVKRSQVIHFFGSVQAVASALNISKQAVNQWGEDSIPLLRQLQLEKIMAGVSLVNLACEAGSLRYESLAAVEQSLQNLMVALVSCQQTLALAFESSNVSIPRPQEMVDRTAA